MRTKLFSNSFMVYVVTLGLMLMTPVQSDEVTYEDNSFSDGDTLSAIGLNSKFNEIKAEINKNHSRISTLEEVKTHYMSIHPSAAQPSTHGYSYQHYNGYLQKLGAGNQHYIVPLQLPHRATVVAVTSYWYDTDFDFNVSINMRRIDRTNGADVMASMMSTGIIGYGLSLDSTIEVPVIDNRLYSYALFITLPHTDTRFAGALIEYTTPK